MLIAGLKALAQRGRALVGEYLPAAGPTAGQLRRFADFFRRDAAEQLERALKSEQLLLGAQRHIDKLARELAYERSLNAPLRLSMTWWLAVRQALQGARAALAPGACQPLEQRQQLLDDISAALAVSSPLAPPKAPDSTPPGEPTP